MSERERVVKGKRISRYVDGYFQDTDAKWWLWNQQRGWVRANTSGQAFREALTTHTKTRLSRGAR